MAILVFWLSDNLTLIRHKRLMHWPSLIINGYHLTWLQERCLHIFQKQLLIREQTSNNSQSHNRFLRAPLLYF